MSARACLALVSAIAGALVLVGAAACGKKQDEARAVPEKEHATPRKESCDAGMCGGTCVDLASDPRRCGACDHACAAGEGCAAGLCAAVVDWTYVPAVSGACPIGTRGAARCPKLTSVHSVWGTDAYTTDSSLCTAALHAGKIGMPGGDVAYEIRPGLPAYVASKRNAYTSMAWGAYPCSFAFVSAGCGVGLARCGDACANLDVDGENCGVCGHVCGVGNSCRAGACVAGLEATVQTTASDPPCSGTRTYHCPPSSVASVLAGRVWGTDLYTSDSALCLAAVHAGKLGPAGGPVTIELLPGASSYKGSTRHGITTSSWAAWTCSYRFK